MNRTIRNASLSMIFVLAAFQMPLALATTPPDTEPDDPLPYCNEELAPDPGMNEVADFDLVTYTYVSRTAPPRCTPTKNDFGTDIVESFTIDAAVQTPFQARIKREARNHIESFISCYQTESGLNCDASPTSSDIALTYFWTTTGDVRVSNDEARTVVVSCANNTSDVGGGVLRLYVSSGYTLGTIEANRVITCARGGGITDSGR